MFTLLTPRRLSKNIKNTRDALRVVEERVIIDPINTNLGRDIRRDEVKMDYIDRFNQGDSIYRAFTPYAEFVKDRHVLYEHDPKGKSLRMLERWPDIVGEPNIYIDEGLGLGTQRLIDLYGQGARTKINSDDIEKWVAYWAIIDIFAGAAILTHNNDSRIPSRDLFLHAYDRDNWSQEFLLSSSEEDIEAEIRLQMQRRYPLAKWLNKLVEEWINFNPDNIYSVHFKGPYIVIDRKIDIKTVAYHAMKEGHPFVQDLAKMNLI